MKGGDNEVVMKEIVWDTPNKMHFDSPHKMFNRQCKLIATGNQIGNVVYSNYIRPHSEIECNGFINKPGHLQNWDLTKNIVADTLPSAIREQIRELTYDKGGIVYNFHHWNGNKRIDDGFVLTTRDEHHKLVKVWYVNTNWRARAAVKEAIKYIVEVNDDRE
jgi:hypothetical protein